MQIHEAVEEIYRRNPAAFEDPRHLVAALSDYVDTDGSGAGEIRLIVDAVALGSFQRLQDLAEVGASPHQAIAEGATTLARNRATDEHRSGWACAVLAYALGLINDADVRVYRARWEQATEAPQQQPQQQQQTPPATQGPPPTQVYGQTQAPPPTPVYGQPTYAPSYSVGPTYAGGAGPRRGVPGWVYALLALVVVVAGVGIALLVVAPWEDSGQEEGGDDPPVTNTPEVGSCHALSTADLSGKSDVKDPVPCDDGTATTVTIDVVTLPDDVNRSDTDAIWAAIGPECTRTSLSYLGGNAQGYALSAYAIAFFVPTAAEEDAGADWARCDLSLLAGGGTTPLPASVEGTIDQLPLADEVALCAEDDANNYLYTTCALPHAYRATTAVYLDGERPPDSELGTLGTEQCDDGSGDYAFAGTPSQETWDAGATYLICFTFDG